MPRLTPEKREQAVATVHTAGTHAFIAITFSCSHVAVTNVMQRYRQTSDKPRTGGPKATTLYLWNRFLAVTSFTPMP